MTPARVRITVRARDGNREVSITRDVPEGRDLVTIAKLAYHTAQLELEASRPEQKPLITGDWDEVQVKHASFACMKCGNVTKLYVSPFGSSIKEIPSCYHCNASPLFMRRLVTAPTPKGPTLGQLLERGFIS